MSIQSPKTSKKQAALETQSRDPNTIFTVENIMFEW